MPETETIYSLGRGQDRERSEKKERGREREQIKREKYFKKGNTARPCLKEARRTEGQNKHTRRNFSLGLEPILSDQFPYFLLSEEIVEQGTLFSSFFY